MQNTWTKLLKKKDIVNAQLVLNTNTINKYNHEGLDQSCSKQIVDDRPVNRSFVWLNMNRTRKPVTTTDKMS